MIHYQIFQLDFLNWKIKLEEETVSFYKIAKGEVNSELLTKKTFECNRSGFYESKGKNIRNLKIQGSRKCNGKCPSKIKATINNKTKRVEVCFIETHAGHKNELKHINIPNEDKKQIVSQLKLGIQFNNVLHNVRCSLTDEKLKSPSGCKK